MVIWLIFAYLLTKNILANSSSESPIADAMGTNLMVTLPLLLVVFVPIYVRKVCREAKNLLQAEASKQF